MERHRDRKRLWFVLILVVAYMAAEIVGGLAANSLALLADAGHMFSDAASLTLSLFALWIAARPATPGHTFGYYRAEILAALVNGAALVVIAVFVAIEAVQRFASPPQVVGPLMMAIAVGGLCVNLAGVWILHGQQSESLNVRGAWLHLMADLMGSVVAVGAGTVIWLFDWYWADPAGSILLAVLVVYSAWRLLKTTIAVLMEATPAHIDLDSVRNTMRSVRGVTEIHDLHVWTITSGLESLSAHVVIDGDFPHDEILQRLRKHLHADFGIEHVTLQLERESCAQPTMHE